MRIKNVPNIISTIRIFMVPLFVGLFFSGIPNARIWATIVYALAAVSDALDGAIARKYKITSTIGKILDPLGDKLINAAAVVCMTIAGIIQYWPVLVFFIKEILMGIGAIVLYRRKLDVFPSNKLGKTSTVVLFLVCAVLMVFPKIPSGAASVMIGGAILLTVATLVVYFVTFLRMMKDKD